MPYLPIKGCSMKPFIHLFNSIALIALVGCGSGSGSEESEPNDDKNSGSNSSCSQDTMNGVQWNKLCTLNATKLSEYQLFEVQNNPTTSPLDGGLPYDLSTPLFTDYATKYRFVFIPPGKTVQYSQNEALEFPIGATLVKTFSMPSNTANRGFENENHIETRLLIKRESGWVALPFVWNSDKSDAVLDFNGASVPIELTHEGVTQNFDYKVPDPQSCINCHGIKLNEDSESIVTPIGPKARFLNMNYDYADGTENQLKKWESEGILTGLPSDMSNVDKTPIVNDSLNIGDLSPSELELAARSWLDINCGHCHRRDPHGLASNTNMQVEWTRDFTTSATEFGVCQKPISFGGDAGDYVIEPGDAEKSLMIFRMNTNDGGDKMPSLGREIIHAEGVELISAWINSMPVNSNCI